ncbi:hypothetical protein GGS20DRAFT_145532 [Poronia punctata]|nr:hypothetical protein GGS20DRAFT_145532 [Poronia punctata]
MDGAQCRQQQHRRPGPRPQKTFREHFVRSLPDYSGPYSVGTMDIEVPVRQPRTFSHIKRSHSHVLRMDTVLFTIYYPCESSSYSVTANKPSRPTWMPRPRVSTCRGYARFLSIPHPPLTAYAAATTMFTKLPAFRNAKLAGAGPNGWPDAHGPADSEGNAPSGQEKSVFPVIMFSHGLGGSRTSYSAICGEMASYGFIVVAMEHRDRSGARTYVNLPPADGVQGVAASKPGHGRSYVVDYLFPKNNPRDTLPRNKKGVDVELRTAQTEMRTAEMEEVYQVLQLINDGHGESVSAANLRKEGNVGSSSKGLENVDWRDWKQRMLLRDVTVMGHSFGGATTVQVLRKKDDFPWAGQGIVLDAWGPAMPKSGGPHESLQRPFLAINSEVFMHWTNNFQSLVDLCEEAKSNGSPCWMLTIKGSTHLSQSDFSVLYPRLMSFVIKTVVHPRRAIYLTVNASLEFLEEILPPGQRLRPDWPKEGILDAQPLDSGKLPSTRKPTDKWMAARLRIPDELSLRLKIRFRGKRKAPKVARDIHGKPLVGIVNLMASDEVWMHYSSST